MIFSSLLFLFWFIPIFFGIYYLVPYKAKNAVLFTGSLIFYAWGEPGYLVLIICSIFFNYIFGILIGRAGEKKNLKKTVFILAICFNVLLLTYYKYAGFIAENLMLLFPGLHLSSSDPPLPLGISFYTFQIMSYIIDAYRGEVKTERSFLRLGTYIVMFPQLIAGPIVVYSDVNRALSERKINAGDIEEGISTFILGLASKVIIANNAGGLFEELAVRGYDNISMPLAWLGGLSFTLQIYFDFNGYSLMAIGLGRMLGFRFPENFKTPYISTSVTEFWRRWHITLGTWFRDYLYIPLGGNRKGRSRTYVNLFIVWLITGLWHGADWNFVIWGMYFFILASLERAFWGDFLIKHRIFAHIYTMFFVIISWVIFSISDLNELIIYLKRMFSFSFNNDSFYYISNYGVILLVACLLSTPLFSGLYNRIRHKCAGLFINIALLLLSVAYLADAGYNPFLYFRF